MKPNVSRLGEHKQKRKATAIVQQSVAQSNFITANITPIILEEAGVRVRLLPSPLPLGEVRVRVRCSASNVAKNMEVD